MSVQDIEIAIFLAFSLAIVAAFLWVSTREQRRSNASMERIRQAEADAYGELARVVEKAWRELRGESDD